MTPTRVRRLDCAWAPTAALHRSLAVGASALVVAVVAHRPDLLVVALPLLGVGVWSFTHRPVQAPQVDVGADRWDTVEGASVAVGATTTGLAAGDEVILTLPVAAQVDLRPASGSRSALAAGPAARVEVAVAPRRYGRVPLGEAQVIASAAWGGYRAVTQPLSAGTLRVHPAVTPFTSRPGLPHPRGLVGLGLSTRSGVGVEPSAVRAFAPGDRLRRIHWGATQRTGALHVTTSYAEEDNRVLLLVDATADVGTPDDHLGTSLDQGVRGAAAVARHLLGTGNRVGLRILADGLTEVPARGGHPHAARVEAALAQVRAPRTTALRPTRTDRWWRRAHTPGDTLVLAFTPLLSTTAREMIADLARVHTVLVVDTLPVSLRGERPALNRGGWGTVDDADYPFPLQAEAWRVLLLERRAAIDALTDTLGVPVVPWEGAGSLDAALVALRRGRAPRAVRR